MTSEGAMLSVCEWCGETFERTTNRGPIPKYCSAAHRQAAHRSRQPETMVGLRETITEALGPVMERQQKQLADAVAPFLEKQQQQWAEMMTPVVEAQQKQWIEMMAPVLEAQTRHAALLAAMAEPPVALAAAQLAAPVIRMQEQTAETVMPVTELQRSFAKAFAPLLERQQEWAKTMAASMPKIDMSAFESRLAGMVDFKTLSEELRPSLDWTRLAGAFGPKLDASVLERVASLVDTSVVHAFVDGLDASVLHDIAKSTGLVSSGETDDAAALEAARGRAALVLLGVLLVAMFSKRVAAGAVEALQTVWLAIELWLQWEPTLSAERLAKVVSEIAVGKGVEVAVKEAAGGVKAMRSRKRASKAGLS